MKKKFLIEKQAFCFFVVLFAIACIFQIMLSVFYPEPTIADKIGIYGYSVFIVLLCPLCLLWKGGYVIFEDNYFIYRESLFTKKQIFQYRDIEKVSLEFAHGGTRYGSRNETIFIYFKKREKWDVHIEIRYELVQQLLNKIPPSSQVRIEFYSLRIFSEKYRELLKDYLTSGQKKEIERLIAKKEAKQKKRTNK